MKTIVTTIILMSIAAFFVCFASDPSVKANPGTSANENAANAHGQSSFALSNDNAANEHTESAQNDSPPWYETAEWWLVIAAIPTLIFVGWQARETARSVEASNRNIEAVMNERRARVEVIADLAWTGTTHISAVSLRNEGPTLGIISDASARLVESVGDVEVDYGECTPLGFTGTIAPGSETLKVVINQDAATIQAGQSVFHFYGFARYEDVYRRAHRVQVHTQWGGNGVWIIAGKPEDNSDTEEKQPEKSLLKRFNDWLDKVSAGPNYDSN
jgi:hypothetical protein